MGTSIMKIAINTLTAKARSVFLATSFLSVALNTYSAAQAPSPAELTNNSLSNIAPKSPQALERLAKVKALVKLNANYKDKVSDGSLVPYQDWIDEANKHTKELERLQGLYAQFLKEGDIDKLKKLRGEILTTLQPIGFFLDDADHSGSRSFQLTKQEAKLQEQLDAEYVEVEVSQTTTSLKLLTPEIYYTFKNIPILVTFQAPEGTEIILSSELGGVFSNKLSKVKIVADDSNTASASWLSYGGGVANCLITYVSAAHNDTGEIMPVVCSPSFFDFTKFTK